MDKKNIWINTKPATETGKNGESYEEFMGRWSRPVAREFVKWLGAAQGKRWLDVGCGTGALTQAILDLASPELVRAIDPTDDYITYARAFFEKDSRVVFQTADFKALHSFTQTFDTAVAGLMLNFANIPEDAVEAMKCVVVDGGLIGAYVWDYNGRMEMLRYFWDAAVELDASVSPIHESQRFSISDQQSLEKLFHSAKLRNVEAHSINLSMPFRNFEDFWLRFQGGQGPAGVYLSSLDAEKREELRESVGRRIKTGPNGAFELEARALAIKGLK